LIIYLKGLTWKEEVYEFEFHAQNVRRTVCFRAIRFGICHGRIA
jgi:hypothetical protein